MSRPRIFVGRRIPEIGIEQLRTVCDVDIWEGQLPPDRQSLLERIAGCAGVLTLLSDRVDAEFMETAGKQLRVISNFAVGYNNIDLAAAAERGVRVGNTPDVLTDATADMALCLLLAAARNLKPAIDAVRNGGWMTWEPMGHLGCQFGGKTVGIVGAGRIGAAFAKRCQGSWDMRVVYDSRSAKPEFERQFSAERLPLDELLATSDVISLHCPLNASTHHLINRQRLERAKAGALLVNTARGEVVDQDALYWALTEGPLAAAGLDVTEPEPLDPNHPLVSLENCIIAPHIGSGTREAREAMSDIAARNILAALAGEAMPAEVNPQ